MTSVYYNKIYIYKILCTCELMHKVNYLSFKKRDGYFVVTDIYSVFCVLKFLKRDSTIIYAI